MREDPLYNINVTGDIKQMLKELGTEKGKETTLHGGGGNKARPFLTWLPSQRRSRRRSRSDSEESLRRKKEEEE
jgi:hypothetical protein